MPRKSNLKNLKKLEEIIIKKVVINLNLKDNYLHLVYLKITT